MNSKETYKFSLKDDARFEVNGKKIDHEVGDTLFTKTIRAGVAQLEGYRLTHKNPSELEWEIRVYNFILGSPDRNDRAEQYLKSRHKAGLKTKRQVVKDLGWNVA